MNFNVIRMNLFLIVFVAILGHSMNCTATPIYLFDGSGRPEDQGWLSFTNGTMGDPDRPLPIITTQTGGGVNDVFQASTSNMTVNEYMRYTGAGSFYVSMRVAVENASFNSHDAGFAFSPIGRSYPVNGTGSNNFVWSDRYYGLYIADNQIGFQDLTASYILDATAFHEYSILYTFDEMYVYMDEQYDDIMGGLATPVLSREIHPYLHPHGGNEWNNLLDGAIVFGDTTNDFGVNSSYTLDYVKFEYLGPGNHPVPEPATILLLGTGVICLTGLGRRTFKKILS